MGSRTPATPSLKPRRVFLDASVLVAAAGRPEGGSAAILDLCRRGALTPLVSSRVLLEAERNVRKKLSPDAVVRYYYFITTVRPRRVPEPRARAVERFLRVINNKDAPVLAAAVAGRAHALITLDRDFVSGAVRRAAGRTEILEPGELLRRLRAEEHS